MRQATIKTASEQTDSSKRLIAFAQAIAKSSSAFEKNFWEQRFHHYIRKLLTSPQHNCVVTALDYLLQQDDITYDICINAVESCSESYTIVHQEVAYDVVLIAAPILAWTRFNITSGDISAAFYTAIAESLKNHIIAKDAKFYLSDALYAIEQLPQDYQAVNKFTQILGQAAIEGKISKHAPQEPVSIPFLADTRYLLAAVAVPKGQAIFQWQEVESPLHIEEAQRKVLKKWREATTPILSSLLVGCHIDLLLPQAYFLSCREADKKIRPLTIKAAIFYLTQTLQVTENKLHISIAKCSKTLDNSMIDEFRLGFSLGDKDDVIYGIIWPLYEDENGDDTVELDDGQPTPLAFITAILEDCGITHIKAFPEIFAAEFCEDCQAPLFPSLGGELLHAGMPEDAPPQQLH